MEKVFQIKSRIVAALISLDKGVEEKIKKRDYTLYIPQYTFQ